MISLYCIYYITNYLKEKEFLKTFNRLLPGGSWRRSRLREKAKTEMYMRTVGDACPYKNIRK